MRTALRARRRDPVLLRAQDDEHRAHRRAAPRAWCCSRRARRTCCSARCTSRRAGERETPLDDADRAAILASIDALAGEALRLIGLAYRRLPAEGCVAETHEQEFVWLGVVGMIDPPRPEAIDAVRRAQIAGVRVIMITGDHPGAAHAIANEIGIARPEDRTVTGTGARAHVGGRPAAGGARRLRLCTRVARAQARDRAGAEESPRDRGDDRRRRERRAGAQGGRHRHRDGDHRHRRLQGRRRHDPRRRQLREHRRRDRGRPLDLREHPEVPALHDLDQPGRGLRDVLRRGTRRRARPAAGAGRGARAAAARDDDPVDQPRHRLGAGARGGRRPGRSQSDGPSAARSGRERDHTLDVAHGRGGLRDDRRGDAPRPRRRRPGRALRRRPRASPRRARWPSTPW